jgi:cold shock CspA family protein
MTIKESKGFLKTWKDDRGFGFIKPEDGSEDIFIHITALSTMARRPFRGDTIYYQVEEDQEGKRKAVNARIEGVANVEDKGVSKKWLWIIAAILGLVSASAAGWYFAQI